MSIMHGRIDRPVADGVAEAEGPALRLPGLLADGLVSGLNAIGTAWICLLMVVINIDIFGRYLFNAPLDGAGEIVAFSITAIVFMQLADAVRRDRMTYADLAVTFLRRRAPRLAKAVEALYGAAAAACFLAILAYVWPDFVADWRAGTYYGNEGVFTFPRWPIKLMLLVGCTATALEYLRRAAGDLRAAFTGALASGETAVRREEPVL